MNSYIGNNKQDMLYNVCLYSALNFDKVVRDQLYYIYCTSASFASNAVYSDNSILCLKNIILKKKNKGYKEC